MSNDVYLKNDLLGHIQSILPLGYTMDGDKFVKTGTNYTASIILDYAEYFPHSARFDGVSLGIRFHHVEQIFTNIYTSNSNVPFGNDSIRSTFDFDFGRQLLGETDYLNLLEKQVFNDESFLQVKPILQNLITAALNFHSQYNTLRDVYNYVESKGSNYWKYYRKPAPALQAIARKLLGINYATDLNAGITRATQAGNTEIAGFYQATKTYLDDL